MRPLPRIAVDTRRPARGKRFPSRSLRLAQAGRHIQHRRSRTRTRLEQMIARAHLSRGQNARLLPGKDALVRVSGDFVELNPAEVAGCRGRLPDYEDRPIIDGLVLVYVPLLLEQPHGEIEIALEILDAIRPGAVFRRRRMGDSDLSVREYLVDDAGRVEIFEYPRLNVLGQRPDPRYEFEPVNRAAMLIGSEFFNRRDRREELTLRCLPEDERNGLPQQFGDRDVKVRVHQKLEPEQLRYRFFPGEASDMQVVASYRLKYEWSCACHQMGHWGLLSRADQYSTRTHILSAPLQACIRSRSPSPWVRPWRCWRNRECATSRSHSR
jgi:hypothetical protein